MERVLGQSIDVSVTDLIVLVWVLVCFVCIFLVFVFLVLDLFLVPLVFGISVVANITSSVDVAKRFVVDGSSAVV